MKNINIDGLRAQHRQRLVIAAFRGKHLRAPRADEISQWMDLLESGSTLEELLARLSDDARCAAAGSCDAIQFAKSRTNDANSAREPDEVDTSPTRLVIDMQGAQSTGSRNRGIGRYTISLTKALVQLRGTSDVFLALNGAFADTIEPIRAEFQDLLPPENIRVWFPPIPCNAVDPNLASRRRAAEKVREAFIGSLLPDVVLVTSLFEGGDDAVTSIGSFTCALPTAVVLYDLIPLIHRHIYLANPVAERWYINKIDHLRRADALLAISSSSGLEAVDYLSFERRQVTNISTACDDHFRPTKLEPAQQADIARRYGLTRPFVMYTGGIDHRKNIEGLIRAYGALPLEIRAAHQVAVVCSVRESDRQRLHQLARECGLDEGELIMTGYVSEEDLVALYNSCKLFVFPSWHEGFGLPALEAMACGRAVIGANTSSVPEVIGRADALFDPRSDASITAKILQVLSDDLFRRELEDYGPRQAAKFSWFESARRAWVAIRGIKRQPEILPRPSHRPRLAYVSPVPGAKSGIADYTAQLLPELARHYEIDVVVCQEEPVDDVWIHSSCTVRTVEWFREHAAAYDRVLYHFGNSHFHTHMFKLLQEVPGAVVLHDFFVGNIISHVETTLDPGSGVWSSALLRGHGWRAVRERYDSAKIIEALWAYPCNLEVLQKALGIIVHSESARRLASVWYGENAARHWAVIPLARARAKQIDRAQIRRGFAIAPTDFVVCSFGFLGESKLNRLLIDAWLASPLSKDPRCRLVFVGQNEGGHYGAAIAEAIEVGGSRIDITGWVDDENFQRWLSAADASVQLRTRGRGETSAAVLDCLNHHVPTIVNAHGSMAELPEDAVYQLADEFTEAELVNALTQLWLDEGRRKELARGGHQLIEAKHRPRQCADAYKQAIENFYHVAEMGVCGLSAELKHIDEVGAEERRRWDDSVSATFPPLPRLRQVLVDITPIREAGVGELAAQHRATLRQSLLSSVSGWKVEAVHRCDSAQRGYRYARRLSCGLLDIPHEWADDCEADAWPDDILICWGGEEDSHAWPAHAAVQQFRQRGGTAYLYLPDQLIASWKSAAYSDGATNRFFWLAQAAAFDGLLFSAEVDMASLREWLDVLVECERPIELLTIPEGTSGDDDFGQRMLLALTRKRHRHMWQSDGVKRFWGADHRLSSQVGERAGTRIRTTNREGFLLFGPYVRMKRGNYECRITGDLTRASGHEYIDIASTAGMEKLAHSVLDSGMGPFERSVNFVLTQPVDDLEVRLWVSEDTDMQVDMVCLGTQPL